MAIKAITAQNLRDRFKHYADNVANYNDVLLIPRPDNKNVVLISEKEYHSWQETNYLLSTANNRKALAAGIDHDAKTVHLTPKDWDQLVNDEKT